MWAHIEHWWSTSSMCESIKNIEGNLRQIENYLSTNKCSQTSHIIHKVDWNPHGWKCKCDWIFEWIPMSCWWCHNCWSWHSRTPTNHPFIESTPLFMACFHHHTRKSNQHDIGNLNWKNRIRSNIMIFINSWKRRFKTCWFLCQNPREIIQRS